MRILNIILVAAACAVAMPAAAAPTTHTLDVARVAKIAATLPPQPAGPGRPIADRAFWAELAKDPSFAAQVAQAQQVKDKPLPDLPDDLYLQFSKNGNRVNYERVAFEKRGRLIPLVLAECLENRGTYLPAINRLVDSLCKEKTWVLPAHDKQLTNFNDSLITIDLFSSYLGWQLAMADYLLGDKLAPATRTALKAEVSRRVVGPYQAMIRGQRKLDGWLTQENNWNPVCLSGATGAALIELPDPRERAECIAAAEHYVSYFLDGFTPDGYCSEGLGYWNYGFGMYSVMAENLRLATKGEVDLFKNPRAFQPSAYGPRINIVNGVIPAFADCSIKADQSPSLLWLLNRIYGWNVTAYKQLPVGATLRSLSEAMLFQDAFADMTPPIKGADVSQAGAGLRTVFEQAGIYLCRQAQAGPQAFAVAFKGGNNAEQHNHNDLGSYVLVMGNTSILLDPGPETYTKRTFSKDRYVSKLLNSYGHSVPVVAGELQRTGKQAQAKVIEQKFSDTTDTVTLDLTSAYDVKPLQKLTRTFEYGRANGGMLIVSDKVEFRKPEAFETALISLGKFYATNGGHSVAIMDDKTVADVQITASAPWEPVLDTINEEAIVKPNRMGIKLKEPVKSATITVAISPRR